MKKETYAYEPDKAQAAEIFLRLISAKYALPEEGMNDQYLEDLASIAIRASMAFEKIYDEEMMRGL